MRINPETTAAVRRAKKSRGFIAPQYSKIARRFMIATGGLYLRFAEGVGRISFIREERIIDAMKRFHAGEHRLIFVFRHAAEEDPPVLMTAFNMKLRARIQKGKNLSHVRFLYGRDVPNWAGSISAWLLPKIGAIPVQNRGGNREALNLLRSEMRNGRFPIILAPEEQVVYHMYHTFEIAPGVSSLVKWGLESGKPVAIVPLALGYRYGKNPETFIKNMLARWEELTGLILSASTDGSLHSQLIEAASLTVAILEDFYNLPAGPEEEKNNPDAIDLRINRLCKTILSAAESTAGLVSEGDNMDRLFRIRYSGVDAFYPEHSDPASEPVLSRALLDFRALESEVSTRHSQIVDVLEYIHMSYINPPFSSGRGCEFILNLLDLINRVNGGNISGHYTPKGQHAVVLAGKPLIYSEASHPGFGRREFLDKIKTDVKTALQDASAELESLWEKIILE